MTTIGICAPPFAPGVKATFDALAETLGVTFKHSPFGDDRNVDGWIVLAAGRQFISEIGRATRPCFVVVDEAELTPIGTSTTITFAERSELAAVLRGRSIVADDAVGARALPAWLPDVVPLAYKNAAAVWATQQRGGCRHDYVALSPPGLSDGEALFTHFSGQRLARLLPLVLFVNALVTDPRWVQPPLQAAFMFDDPNLHWPSYGFIDYREMVRHAAAGNYHVSVATIPLDAWFVHSPTSAIFKEHAARLSLLYHGNDHVFRELARSQSAESMRTVIRQAVSRIGRMEIRTRLEVARVMAPPHGACSEIALAEMARAGFEAACVSRGSLQHYNPDAAWPRAIGMKPCDVVAGLPVIPRFGLSQQCRNDILIAALLRQPIVPMTHHQGVADGYALLDETAAFVNSLGEVGWRDLKSISRSLYSHRIDGPALSVRMFGKRITVPVPACTNTILVERPWLDGSTDETLCWRTTADRHWTLASHPDPVAIAVRPGLTVEIACGATASRRHARDAGPVRLTPIARRVLTEVRDRALPSVRRLARPRVATGVR